jgi:short-subunit dehydrogenase
MNSSLLSQKAFRKAKGYFQNKVVWITGASSGIGEQLALQLHQLNAKLILSARSEEGLYRVKDQMNGNKDDVHILPLDLSAPESLNEKIQQTLSVYGYIDILINNAGLAMRDFALNTDLEIDRKIMNVNYFGTIALTKALLPGMISRKSGHIVVISSMQGKYGVPRSAAYAASKHALHGFFSSLRTEIDTHIVPITIIIPGIIQTEITKHAMKGDGSLYGKQEQTQAEGYPASKTAACIITAIANRKEEVFIGRSEGATLFINRFAPRLMNRMIAHHPIRTIRKIKEKFHLSKKPAATSITTS